MPQQHAEDQQPALTDTLSLAHHDVKSRAESISAKVRTVPASSNAGSQHLMRQHARVPVSPHARRVRRSLAVPALRRECPLQLDRCADRASCVLQITELLDRALLHQYADPQTCNQHGLCRNGQASESATC